MIMLNQRGSGTALSLGAMAVVVAVLSVALVIGAYGVADHRATTAADQAALSGALAASEGHDGCAAARAGAERNGARLVDCTETGDAFEQVVAVVVEVDLPHRWPGLPATVRARAWAGQVEQ
ncbi:Rv3654c family TadE-like protein [Propionibacteriaceae bacterium Y1700]|uniref:Rv3654c family TadE-like protein n=1 Tax=Microlunatus sp. Y1700 TaxID=3418487 RepID=UPI003DA77394